MSESLRDVAGYSQRRHREVFKHVAKTKEGKAYLKECHEPFTAPWYKAVFGFIIAMLFIFTWWFASLIGAAYVNYVGP